MSKNPFKFKIPEGMVACGGVLRMYPSDEQLQPFFQSFGNNRYVWNQFKDMFDTRYKNNHDSKIPNKNDRYAILTQLKKSMNFLN